VSKQASTERPIFHVCVASDGSYMVRPQKASGTQSSKIYIPWLDSTDPRMFVRNGELIKPYGIVEFEYLRTVSWPELNHDIAFYKEASRTGFDPTGCVPINYFDIEKVGKQLNEAHALLEERIPDESAQSAA
jgi:hypothetical protein